MKRRAFLATAGSLFLGSALAQSKHEPVRVGWLHTRSRESSLWMLAAFKAGMLARGWKEDEQYVLVERWADSLGAERLAVLAREIAVVRPAVIVAAPNDAVRAALKASPDTAVVMAVGTDPVGHGFAASLARPGGMATGNANLLDELGAKFPELLLAAAPGARRIGFLLQDQGLLSQMQLDNTRRIAKSQSLDAVIGEVRTVGEVEPTLARFATERVQGLIVNVGPLLFAKSLPIVQTALKHKWPMIAFASQFADEGALMSYGPDFAAQFERAAQFVDRLLKGAKPAELPFEQPTKFDFVVNMKTARTLGLKIPQSLLLRASRVIE